MALVIYETAPVHYNASTEHHIPCSAHIYDCRGFSRIGQFLAECLFYWRPCECHMPHPEVLRLDLCSTLNRPRHKEPLRWSWSLLCRVGNRCCPSIVPIQVKSQPPCKLPSSYNEFNHATSTMDILFYKLCLKRYEATNVCCS